MIEKICIVYSHHKLGDLIWQLPYIKSISEHHNKKIDLVVREKTQAKEILKDLNYINTIHYNNFRKKIFYWMDVFKLKKIFFTEDYTHVYILDKINKPAIAAKLAGIKNIIGPVLKDKNKALEKAILDSTDLLETGDYGAVENKIRDATQVSLVKDLGLEYFENPKERLEWIKQQSGAVSTGWKMFDQKLYGGLNKGEITIFAGGSGAGKSLFLQNLAVNWALSGLNCVYISLELSEQLISMRLDAMVSEHGTKDVMRNIDDVDLKVRMKGKGAGKFRVKQMTSGVNANDIRAYIREYEINADIKAAMLAREKDKLAALRDIKSKLLLEATSGSSEAISEEVENKIVVQKPVDTAPKKPDTTLLAGEKFLKENAKRKEIKVTESGLQYQVIKAGSGPKPNAGSTVKVHYHGTNIYGQVFDSSIDRGKPIEFPLNQVIAGWTEGLQLMKEGGKFIFYIPQELGYGARGAGGQIPPYATLIFEVELLQANIEN